MTLYVALGGSVIGHTAEMRSGLCSPVVHVLLVVE